MMRTARSGIAFAYLLLLAGSGLLVLATVLLLAIAPALHAPAIYFYTAAVVAFLGSVLRLSSISATEVDAATSPGRHWWQRNNTLAATVLAACIVVFLGLPGPLTMSREISHTTEVTRIFLYGRPLWTWHSAGGEIIRRGEGLALLLDIKAPPSFVVLADSNAGGSLSQLQVWQDGQLLPMPHSMHADIQVKGSGRYSHWGPFLGRNSMLYFSTLDNTHPRLDGVTFRIRYRIILNPYITIIGLFFGTLALIHLLRMFGYRVRLPVFLQYGRISAWFSAVIIYSLLGIVFVFPLYTTWRDAPTTYALIAGYLPWTDGAGWRAGALHLLHTGVLTEWTQRRPVNAAVHAMVTSLFGERLNWTLACYALVAALMALLFASEIRRTLGLISALIALAVAAYFTNDFLPLTFSETLGIILGLLGFVLMWRAIDVKDKWLFAVGLCLLTTAFSARPGPMLVLPALTLWAAISGVGGTRFSASWFGASIVGILFGMVPTLIFSQFYGTGENLPASNFSYTLYGLALGGESWQRGYTDFPQWASLPEAERAKHLFHAALAHIREQPGLFLSGMGKFLSNFAQYLFVYVDDKVLAPFFRAGYWLGLVLALIRIRHPRDSFLLAGILGGIASAPLIYWSYDAHRAYAATIPFDAVLCTLPIALAASWVRSESTNAYSHLLQFSTRSLTFAGFSAYLVVMIGPVVAVSSYHLKHFTDERCSNGTLSNVLHLGHSSSYIWVMPPDSKTFVPRISSEKIATIPDIHDFGIDSYISNLQPGQLFIWGFDLENPESPPRWYIAPRSLLPLDGVYYRICGPEAISLDPSGLYAIRYITAATALPSP